ncbi:MAG TPA: hypothetical protein VIH91_10895, partial [Terriglobales bacterium]
MLSSGMADRRWSSSNTILRRIRSDEAEIRARVHQHLDPGGKIVRQFVQPPGVEHGDALLDVKAVEDDVRIPAIRLPRTI